MDGWVGGRWVGGEVIKRRGNRLMNDRRVRYVEMSELEGLYGLF